MPSRTRYSPGLFGGKEVGQLGAEGQIGPEAAKPFAIGP
jgi:hypothetical protein